MAEAAEEQADFSEGLLAAIAHNQADGVAQLLELGQTVKRVHLLLAARTRGLSQEVFRLLVESRATADTVRSDARLLFLEACRANNHTAIDGLVKLGLPEHVFRQAQRQSVYAGNVLVAQRLFNSPFCGMNDDQRMEMLTLTVSHRHPALVASLLSASTREVWGCAMLAPASQHDLATLETVLSEGILRGFVVSGQANTTMGNALCAAAAVRLLCTDPSFDILQRLMNTG